MVKVHGGANFVESNTIGMVELGHDEGFSVDIIPDIWIELRKSQNIQCDSLVEDDAVSQPHLAEGALATDDEDSCYFRIPFPRHHTGSFINSYANFKRILTKVES